MLLSETIVILIPCNSANVPRYCYTFQIKFNFMVKKVFHRNEWYGVYYSYEEYICLL